MAEAPVEEVPLAAVPAADVPVAANVTTDADDDSNESAPNSKADDSDLELAYGVAGSAAATGDINDDDNDGAMAASAAETLMIGAGENETARRGGLNESFCECVSASRSFSFSFSASFRAFASRATNDARRCLALNCKLAIIVATRCSFDTGGTRAFDVTGSSCCRTAAPPSCRMAASTFVRGSREAKDDDEGDLDDDAADGDLEAETVSDFLIELISDEWAMATGALPRAAAATSGESDERMRARLAKSGRRNWRVTRRPVEAVAEAVVPLVAAEGIVVMEPRVLAIGG